MSTLCLSLPSDEGRSTRQVLNAFLKRLTKDYFGLPRGTYPKSLYDTAAATAEIVKNTGKGPILNLMRRPQLHVFLNCAVTGIVERDAAWAKENSEKMVFQTLFELAVDGLLPAKGVAWPRPVPMTLVGSPLHRIHLELPADAKVHFHNGAIEVDGTRKPLERGSSDQYVPLADGMNLALMDTNPISDFEAHPDKQGNQLSLGTATADDWADMLRRSLAVIERHMPGIYDEMKLIIQQFIPVGTDDEKHLSASYKESVGTIYMTLHPQLMTMVEAAIHEFQHNKINMLFRMEPVFHNAFFPLFTSPVRPDPRPLHGILLAAHAFVPVAELYRRIEASDDELKHWGGFRDRFGAIVKKNSDALYVLNKEARATDHGKAILDELTDWNRQHRLHLGLPAELS